MLSLFCYACKDCKETTVIPFTDKDKEWLIYQKNKIFIYTNQKNDTLIYVTEKAYDFPFRDVNSSNGGFYPSFDAGCVNAKWDGMRVKLQNTTTKKDSIDIWLQKSVVSNSSGYRKEDGLSPRIYWYSNKYSRIIPDTKTLDSLSLKTFDTLIMPNLNYRIPDLLLKKVMLKNGKVYDNILLSEDKWNNSGTNFIETKTRIFYHKTTGIIRFETANDDIWELE